MVTELQPLPLSSPDVLPVCITSPFPFAYKLLDIGPTLNPGWSHFEINLIHLQKLYFQRRSRGQDLDIYFQPTSSTAHRGSQTDDPIPRLLNFLHFTAHIDKSGHISASPWSKDAATHGLRPPQRRSGCPRLGPRPWAEEIIISATLGPIPSSCSPLSMLHKCLRIKNLGSPPPISYSLKLAENSIQYFPPRALSSLASTQLVLASEWERQGRSVFSFGCEIPERVRNYPLFPGTFLPPSGMDLPFVAASPVSSLLFLIFFCYAGWLSNNIQGILQTTLKMVPFVLSPLGVRDGSFYKQLGGFWFGRREVCLHSWEKEGTIFL